MHMHAGTHASCTKRCGVCQSIALSHASLILLVNNTRVRPARAHVVDGRALELRRARAAAPEHGERQVRLARDPRLLGTDRDHMLETRRRACVHVGACVVMPGVWWSNLKHNLFWFICVLDSLKSSSLLLTWCNLYLCCMYVNSRSKSAVFWQSVHFENSGSSQCSI